MCETATIQVINDAPRQMSAHRQQVHPSGQEIAGNVAPHFPGRVREAALGRGCVYNHFYLKSTFLFYMKAWKMELLLLPVWLSHCLIFYHTNARDFIKCAAW